MLFPGRRWSQLAAARDRVPAAVAMAAQPINKKVMNRPRKGPAKRDTQM
jgi:hypothetical protein